MPRSSSPSPDAGPLITWHAWQEAVPEATASDKPIFLCLVASWCRFCQALDQGPLSDYVLADILNRFFVPTRVDVDERPDIALRYSTGGWPTVAFLTPEGEMLTGASQVSREELAAMADSVREAWETRREDIAGEVAELQLTSVAMLDAMRREPARRELTPEFLRFLLSIALSAYDEEYGGFGKGAKFPRPDILETLVVILQGHRDAGDADIRRRAAVVLRGTLEAIARGGLHDREGGGFFRYAAFREWESPHTEKMLSDNAALASVLAGVAKMQGDHELMALAKRTVEFISQRLWRKDAALYGAYLPAGATGHQASDSVGPAYTGPNATAARALVALARAETELNGESREARDLLTKAEQVAARLWQRRSARGLVNRTDTGEDSYLDDQVAMLEMMLVLVEAGLSDWKERAEALWGSIDRYFSVAQNSALLADFAAPVNVPEDSRLLYKTRVGRLTRTETPLGPNARLAGCLAALYKTTQDAALRQRALDILQQLAPAAAAAGTYSIGLVRAALLAGLQL